MLERERIEGWLSGFVPALAPGVVHETLYERMSRTTGLELRDETDVAFIVQAGVPAAAYERSAAELRLPLGYLLSAAQMKLELALHRCLPPEAGDRLMRAVRLHAQATLMLGGPAEARSWLHSPLRWHAGVVEATPLQLALRDSGARLAEQLLLRTVHGVH